ncbi:MAG TPA: glycosyl hydrolase family 28-related protein [Bdellovibrionota bacterium]|jgi:hypothetical protein|nr:glycosyl hydrolase family 28-related protein [Bdellovibrionota bacterium]
MAKRKLLGADPFASVCLIPALFVLLSACQLISVEGGKAPAQAGDENPETHAPLDPQRPEIPDPPSFSDAEELASEKNVLVYNVRDYGALGNDAANDTLALRAAYNDAAAAGGGVIYIPEGIYRVAPTVEGDYVFRINHSNMHFIGDGPTKTILSAYALNMQDPESLIPRRGGMFTTLGLNYDQSIEDISIRNLRATGNARMTDQAGAWWDEEQQKTGWDMTHKGLGIWGRVTDVLVDNVEMDHWRGEILYAGGGEELGTFVIRNSKIHDCNASAISMGGKVSVLGSEIYDVYNGFENFSFSTHGTLVKDSVIEVNRNLPKDGMTKRVGGFGVTYLGLKGASLWVENNRIGHTQNGGVFLSEFAHNVTLKGNTFVDTVGLYAIDLYMQPYHNFRPENDGFKNILVENNQFLSVNGTSAERGILTYGSMENVIVRGNTFGNDDPNDPSKNNTSFRIPGCVYGDFVIEKNTFYSVPFAHTENMTSTLLGKACKRPTWISNNFFGRKGEDIWFYGAARTFDLVPIGQELFITDVPSGSNFRIDPAYLASFPVGYKIKFVLYLGQDRVIKFAKDAAWNDFAADVVMQSFPGNPATLTIIKNASGKFSKE